MPSYRTLLNVLQRFLIALYKVKLYMHCLQGPPWHFYFFTLYTHASPYFSSLFVSNWNNFLKSFSNRCFRISIIRAFQTCYFIFSLPLAQQMLTIFKNPLKWGLGAHIVSTARSSEHYRNRDRNIKKLLENWYCYIVIFLYQCQILCLTLSRFSINICEYIIKPDKNMLIRELAFICSYLNNMKEFIKLPE